MWCDDSRTLHRKLGAIREKERRKHERAKARSWGSGFATIQGITRQWDLLRQQIGHLWKDWTQSEIVDFLNEIRPIADFRERLLDRLGSERHDLS
jgi:hypothetical protein